MELYDVLATAVNLGASDIHLAAGAAPLVRVNGEIMDLPGCEALSAERCKALIYSTLYEEKRALFERELELDCSIVVPKVARFRINVMLQRDGLEATLRVIPSAIPLPEYLGLGPIAMGLADLPRGLVLVTGPTGAGKSTTVACMVERINQRCRKHIITIEDPIEFVYSRRKSLISQREIGAHTHSFHEALRHALRQDPDVIVIGEMRDLETISLALTAAETGHLCLASLHTIDAAQTVDRIVDVFPAHQQQQVRVQLADCLNGVLSQILLPRKSGTGRIAARELMLVTPAIAHMIREGKTHLIPNAIDTSGQAGMFSMETSLNELIRRGIVDATAARAKSPQPDIVHNGSKTLEPARLG